jgi:phosphatidylserine/phosphatidylglycerophosphate/cardiolipin synthase-like enzyme
MTGRASIRRVFAVVCCIACLAMGRAAAFDPGAPGADAVSNATGTVEVAFAPWDDAEGAVLRVIREARSEIYVQAFLFTSRAIGRALVEAWRRGLRVEVLADRDMNSRGDATQIPSLAAAGIPVALEVRYSAAHNKVIIADPNDADCAVVTGSYNFTYSARAKNAENVLVLRRNQVLARAYYNNWLRHRAEAVPYEESQVQTN